MPGPAGAASALRAAARLVLTPFCRVAGAQQDLSVDGTRGARRTRTRNQARLVFDVNAPIDTDVVLDTIGFPSCAGDCDGSAMVTVIH